MRRGTINKIGRYLLSLSQGKENPGLSFRAAAGGVGICYGQSFRRFAPAPFTQGSQARIAAVALLPRNDKRVDCTTVCHSEEGGTPDVGIRFFLPLTKAGKDGDADCRGRFAPSQ